MLDSHHYLNLQKMLPLKGVKVITLWFALQYSVCVYVLVYVYSVLSVAKHGCFNNAIFGHLLTSQNQLAVHSNTLATLYQQFPVLIKAGGHALGKATSRKQTSHVYSAVWDDHFDSKINSESARWSRFFSQKEALFQLRLTRKLQFCEPWLWGKRIEAALK